MNRLLFLLLFMLPISVFAQTGAISGTIKDKDTGETLPGVTIIIKGTSLGAATDLDGKYIIRGMRRGEYTLEISYVGYGSIIYTGIKVEDGATTQLDVELSMQVLESDEEVLVIGERPIFDVEKSNSSAMVSAAQIAAAPVRRVEDVVGLQAGVTKDPTGLYIKGGRAYETGYVVDGVSAQDPLAGTGFGLDLGANAMASVEVITGGVGAEYGDVTSGVVAVKTQDGGEKFKGFFSHKRDNPGRNTATPENFFNDIYEFNIGGPSLIFEKFLKSIGIDLPGTISFFFSGQTTFSDEFTKISANQVSTSLLQNNMWSPRQDNRWNGMSKLTWNIKPGMKLQGAYQRSLTVNQNTRMLQITQADVQIQPGFQFDFLNDLDAANTYAAATNLAYLKWTHTTGVSSFYDVQVSRLFTRLRADANGRNWRPDQVDGELDPESIVTYPATEFPVPGDFRYVLAGPGLVNNGGLARLFHDHYAEEYTVKTNFTRFYNDKQNQLNIGFETKFQDYQWIDITRPWVGAPIEIGDGEFSETSRLGETSDIWQVNPRRGALFVNNQIRYQGLIANVGVRLEYWSPGKYVDDSVDNPDAPIVDAIRQGYKDDTFMMLGLRTKARLLPKLSVSFPVRENQVLFFNYGHSTRVPHPSFVYAGLDPFYQDRSFLSNLGNPNLNPEVSINYEIGLRNQITSNDALNISAFWNDRYDFITSERIIINDASGRPSERSFRVNGDFARSRGVEATYIKRHKDWFQGQLSITYSRAEGLSSTTSDALQSIIVGGQAIGNNIETPLAWDRPWDIKTNFTFTYDRKEALLGLAPLNKLRLFTSVVWRSGVRYTPFTFRGFQTPPSTEIQGEWRPIYDRVNDPTLQFSEVGPSWFTVDLNLQRWFTVRGMKFTAFLEVMNLLNRQNVIRINPVTGEGYRTNYPDDPAALIALRDDRRYDVPSNVRDPRYVDPRDNSRPRYADPSNFLEQRHIMFGMSVNF